MECQVQRVKYKVRGVMCKVQELCTCHTERCSAHLQTGENVRKCRACHTERHHKLPSHLQKGWVCSFPYRHGDAPGKPETRDETSWSIKRAFRARRPQIFILRRFEIEVFLRVFLGADLKIHISCEASLNFLSQNATPATEFAHCQHFAQR